MAFHLKLDELIHALHGARNELIDLEHLTDDELDHIQKEFQRLAKTRQPLVNGTRLEQADEQPQAQTDE
jgi:low affinity Fe/Cu permease